MQFRNYQIEKIPLSIGIAMSLMPNILGVRLAVMHWIQSRGVGHQELQKCVIFRYRKHLQLMIVIFFVLNFIPCFKFNLYH